MSPRTPRWINALVVFGAGSGWGEGMTGGEGGGGGGVLVPRGMTQSRGGHPGAYRLHLGM